jgi:topoisomerase-4 subunit A
MIENNKDFAEELSDSDENQETSSNTEVQVPGQSTTRLSGMYQDWFLDYASYVILERAVPDVSDGLKPVQRRILHSMKEMDDGRFNKVANIIGNTMKYHPHGDASIGDALVQLGQKELLVDTQGNWGNILTGDSAAAARYIEARPSKFALEVLFNAKTTKWKSSYDGRNKEPINLPAKFPLLLAQGVEGIAVGLASKILPHNFIELIEASIKYYEGAEPNILPDFPTGGMADFSKYNGGLRGGKVRVRARINILDKKTLTITEVPFGTTTGSLIDSIISANDKGKIKIRKIEDNTAGSVEVLVHLLPGVSPDQTIDALYAFTDCEVSISPNSCVIDTNKPRFLDVNHLLKISCENTKELLRRELEIEKHELMEQLLFSSLEKIFIENRIYHDIEECETWESVIETIFKGLEPYKDQFYRDITRDDIIRLTEIKIKRISRFDSFKADDIMKGLDKKLNEVNKNLSQLTKFTIDYFERIKEKFGKGRERKTEIRFFDTIEATRVAVANEKLYVNRQEGFAGIGMKKDEYVCDCSDIDDIIVFRRDGKCLVSKVSQKTFVGKDIIHIGVFEKNDDRTIFNMMYQDGKGGAVYMKRFAVKGITRDKEYDLTKGTKDSKVIYFTSNPNGEAEVVSVHLRHKPKLKKPVFEIDFAELAIKGRSASGNIVTKNPVRKVVLKDEGVSTLAAMDIWFDDTVLRLNTEKRGRYIGAFKGDDKLLAISSNGTYRIIGYDLATHFDENPLMIRKLSSELVVSVIYFDSEQGFYYIKRFEPESNGKPINFIGEIAENKLTLISDEAFPLLQVNFAATDRKEASTEEIDIESFIGVKGYKAKGKRLTTYVIESMEWLEPTRQPEVSEEIEGEEAPDEGAERQKTPPPPTSKDSSSEPKEFIEQGEITFEWEIGQESAPTYEDNITEESSTEFEDSKKPLPRPSKKPPITPGDREKQIRLDLDI